MEKSNLRGLVVKYPECILDEVKSAIELLQDRVNLDMLELNQINDSLQYDFLVIPGGSCDLAIEHDGLKSLIKKVKTNSGLLAGICNGALVLASAGVLKGEKCTHTAHPKYAPLPEFKELLEVSERLFDGSQYVDEDVVISGKIITAKPHVSDQFAETIMSCLDF